MAEPDGSFQDSRLVRMAELARGRWRQPLLAVVRKCFGRKAEDFLDDFLQTVLLRRLNDDVPRDDASLYTYLAIAVRNLCIDEFRARERSERNGQVEVDIDTEHDLAARPEHVDPDASSPILTVAAALGTAMICDARGRHILAAVRAQDRALFLYLLPLEVADLVLGPSRSEDARAALVGLTRQIEDLCCEHAVMLAAGRVRPDDEEEGWPRFIRKFRGSMALDADFEDLFRGTLPGGRNASPNIVRAYCGYPITLDEWARSERVQDFCRQRLGLTGHESTEGSQS